ncbi:MAG: MerR family transcriptional regulator [Desulfobacterales bacterium]|nr:MerR family transcriptional regulator [Desulfobacterales bacterium]
MYTIGQISKKYNISRSTLIYYDKIGLLSPSERSFANYRIYTDADNLRMEKIDTYKKAGVPLKDIGMILDSKNNIMVPALEKRLVVLNKEISNLRGQQRKITDMLKNTSSSAKINTFDKKSWIKILKASGMSDKDLNKWHVEFEKVSPEAHQDFLESLGMNNKEIKKIRKESIDK